MSAAGRVLQKKKKKKKQNRRYLLIACLIDYKELTHMITEVGKSQDLQGESPAASFTGWSLKTWDPGELRVTFWSEVQPASGPGRAWRFRLSLRLEESQRPQFEGSQAGGFLQISHFLLVFLFSLHLFAQGLPTYQRAICFTKSTDLISSKNSLMEAPRLCFTQYLGPLWPSQADT